MTSRLASTAVLALALSACGSTVRQQTSPGGATSGLQPSQVQTTGAAAGDAPVTGGAPITGATTLPGTGVQAGPGSTAAAGGTPVPVTTARGATRAGATASRTVTRTGAGKASTSAAVGASGPGVSAKEIRVGIAYVKGADQAYAAMGFSQLSLGDTLSIYKHMVAWTNSHGGLAGRKVVPVEFASNATDDKGTANEQACAAFTQDDKVFFGTGVTVGSPESGDNLLPCLSKAGTSWIPTVWSGDAGYWSTFRQFLHSPNNISHTRELSALVDSVAMQGFFDGAKPKIGLIQIDRPPLTAAVEGGLKPALAKRGLKVDVAVSVASDNNLPAAVANAELKFATSGVTHVFFAGPGGGVPVYFMSAAQSQGYKPTYALSSWDAPSVVGQLAPQEQLKGTLGQGYLPSLDVNAAQDPGGTAATKACLAIYSEAGFDMSNRIATGTMLAACDTFLMAKKALDGQASITAATFAAGVERIGSDFVPAGTFATRMRPDAHDGAAGYRFLVFDSGCSCFTYKGGTRGF
jgi:hypothetical protein